MVKEKTKKRLGRYEVLEEIGRGGMAVVYRAHDLTLNRDIALKLLHPHLTTQPEARKRFEREAHAVASLHHNSIVEVYDYSDAEADEIYIVMELVKGTTLRKFIDERIMHKQTRQSFLAESAALIVRAIFISLEVAHKKQIVHRDVKPENILLESNGSLKLSDFGIAHIAGGGQMTVTGQILGSPAYMSPEHIEQSVLDARADIFSVGTILYEMTVGSLPFHGNSPHQIIKRVVEGYYDNPLSINPLVGNDIASIITKCLQREPERRFGSAREAILQLDNALSAIGITSPDKELKLFFSDPNGWEEKNQNTIKEKTLNLGKLARKENRLPEAMNHFNRILAMEPGNEQALDEVSGLSRKRRLKRTLERITVALAISISILVVVWSVIIGTNPNIEFDSINSDPTYLNKNNKDKNQYSDYKDAEINKMNTSLSENPASSNGTKPLNTSSDKQINDSIKNTLKSSTKTSNRSIVKNKEKRNVIFNPRPMRVEILIDSKEKFAYKTTDRARKLYLGNHTVQFIPKNKGLEPFTKHFIVKRGKDSMTVSARLKWKPALLFVGSNINAIVAIEGLTNGKTNVQFPVPITDGPNKKIKFLVSTKGYRPTTRQVTLTAGETQRVIVNLIQK